MLAIAGSADERLDDQRPTVDANDAELWAGTAIIVLAAATLVVPLVVAVKYTLPLFAAAVIAMAVGAVLVGWSRKGRAV